MARCGVPEIERLENLGVLDERFLVVHSGWLEPHEMEMLVRLYKNMLRQTLIIT